MKFIHTIVNFLIFRILGEKLAISITLTPSSTDCEVYHYTTTLEEKCHRLLVYIGQSSPSQVTDHPFN